MFKKFQDELKNITKERPYVLPLYVAIVGYVELFITTNYVIPYFKRNKETGFSSTSTALQVSENVDLRDKVAIVTGANTGIGKETARVLALRGATVVITGRDSKTLNQVKEEFVKEIKGAIIHAIELDLGDKESVHKFVDEFKKLKLPLHYLILNAGIMSPYKEKCKDGFELNFGVNHFGNFRLTMLLLPIMKDTKYDDKRIVVLSSDLHFRTPGGKIIWDDINMEKPYYGMEPYYCHSKLANVMFARELNKMLLNSKVDITVNSVMPGIIKTELHRNDSWISKTIQFLITPIFALVRKNIGQGAATTVFATVSPTLKGKGGNYLANCTIAKALEYTNNDEECTKLWKLSEKETNEKYPF